MHNASQLPAVLLVCLLVAGCSKQSPRSSSVDHAIAATQGFLRLHDVEPKDIRYVLTQLAEAKQWERVSNAESGSYSPTTKEDLVRATHLYRDQDGHEIRVDWVWEQGRDTLLLVSSDSVIRESVSTAIGVNLLRRQQGRPLLTD